MTEQAWVEKYRPKTTKDVQGNNKDVKELKQWVQTYKRGDKPQLLVGQPGVGKSSSIQAIANELDIPLMEINASSARTSDDIEQFVHDAQATPFGGGKKIVMLDEADSMSGRSNLKPLYDMLDDAANPTVVIVNDEWETLGGIKSRCNTRKFNLSTPSIKSKLKKIAKSEGLDIPVSTLERLANRESLRDAIQDFQQYVDSDETELRSDTRNYDQSVFDAVDDVIRGEQTRFEEPPTQAIQWIDQNIRGRYRMVEAWMAWDALSRSDMYLQKAGGDDYSWWKYAGALQDQVPNMRLTKPWHGYIKKSPPNWGREKRDKTIESVFKKLSGIEDSRFKLDCSYREFKRVYLPILEALDIETKQMIALNNGLDSDEVGVIGLDSAQFKAWREADTSDIPDKYEEDRAGGIMEW